MHRFVCSFVIVVCLVACGGAVPSGATSATATGASTGSGTGDAPDAKVSFESLRETFMTHCLAKMTAPDYCACAFDQFREVFKGTDMSSTPPDGDPRLQAVREKTRESCASKLTEEVVKPNFFKECTGGESTKDKYCQCSWTTLRKTLALADLMGDDTTSPRYKAAQKSLTVTCKGLYPQDLAKTEFMSGCTGGNAKKNKTCDCLWGKLRAKYSLEEVVAGLADLDGLAGVKECVTN
jgi:hypothetical protein